MGSIPQVFLTFLIFFSVLGLGAWAALDLPAMHRVILGLIIGGLALPVAAELARRVLQ